MLEVVRNCSASQIGVLFSTRVWRFRRNWKGQESTNKLCSSLTSEIKEWVTKIVKAEQNKRQTRPRKTVTFPHIYPRVFFCPSSWYEPSSLTQKCGLPAHWTPANCTAKTGSLQQISLATNKKWLLRKSLSKMFLHILKFQPATSEALLLLFPDH